MTRVTIRLDGRRHCYTLAPQFLHLRNQAEMEAACRAELERRAAAGSPTAAALAQRDIITQMIHCDMIESSQVHDGSESLASLNRRHRNCGCM